MTGHRPRRRPPRRLGRTAAIAGVAGLVFAASGCSLNSGTGLARQACVHVQRSLTLYQASLDAHGARRAGTERDEALAQLGEAMPEAAEAAGADGEYQALAATLKQSSHLPESLLVHALSAQCAAVDAGSQILSNPVTTYPPGASAPTTTSATGR